MRDNTSFRLSVPTGNGDLHLSEARQVLCSKNMPTGYKERKTAGVVDILPIVK